MDLAKLPPAFKLDVLRRLQASPTDDPDLPDCCSASDNTPPPGLPPLLHTSRLTLITGDTLRELHDHGFAVVDGFLRDGKYADTMSASGVDLAPASMNTAWSTWVDGSIRGDSMTFLRRDDPTIPDAIMNVRKLLDKLAQEIGSATGMSVPEPEIQLARYDGNGSRYRAHLDSTATRCSHRTITAVLYLPSEDREADRRQWDPVSDGGCLKLHLSNGRHRLVEPQPNRLVLFASRWMLHEVLPCYRVRTAMTAWISLEAITRTD
ncbi:Fe2OG dioxygenase domain-containing protein [Plasmodiophora brassicae]|uniref:Fe2OG dioxygenase domain-containing protein n=1 Tax=Plasmodiophora brassicae TaxID=37360 RepID=A0A0G4IYU0_PLABS|nr:hypothetical protein PBRA_007920 [Plasmodiophora brassicae]SPQ96455.1 unnamed protein product [Plasmodiophora brassicae]